MGWVNERLEGTDSSQLYKFKFLALKGSSFYIFSTPPVKKLIFFYQIHCKWKLVCYIWVCFPLSRKGFCWDFNVSYSRRCHWISINCRYLASFKVLWKACCMFCFWSCQGQALFWLVKPNISSLIYSKVFCRCNELVVILLSERQDASWNKPSILLDDTRGFFTQARDQSAKSAAWTSLALIIYISHDKNSVSQEMPYLMFF